MSKPATSRARGAAAPDCCERAPADGALDLSAFASLFKALGDETRLAIVAMLASCGDRACACDIEGRFDLSQPTISHHLRILREAGLISGERRGTWIHYGLERDALARIAECVKALRAMPAAPGAKESK